MTVVRFRHHRQGRLAYALERLRGVAFPRVAVSEPLPGRVVVERDVPVAMRDGTVLRVNVHRPPQGGPWPVLLSAHPYGKDRSGGALTETAPARPGSERFHTRRETAVFTWTFPRDTELTGPMAARLRVESPDVEDVDLVVAEEKQTRRPVDRVRRRRRRPAIRWRIDLP